MAQPSGSVNWMRILCPNCQITFDDDRPVLEDGALFVCPECDARITVTMTWSMEDDDVDEVELDPG